MQNWDWTTVSKKNTILLQGLGSRAEENRDKLAFDQIYLPYFPDCKFHAACGAIWLNIGLFQHLNILFWKTGHYFTYLVSTTKETADRTFLQVLGHLQVASDGMHAKGFVRVTDDYLLILKLYLKAELKSLVHSFCNPFYMFDFILSFIVQNHKHSPFSGQFTVIS